MRPCPRHLASLCRTSLDSRVPDSWVPSSSPEFLISGSPAHSPAGSPAASCDSGRLLWCEGLTYSLEIGHLGTVPPLSLQGPALILALVGLTGWTGSWWGSWEILVQECAWGGGLPRQ